MKFNDINEWVCGKCSSEPCRCDNKTNELKIEKPDSVSTKGLKRAEMPQIHKNDYKEFIDYLQDNGAEFTKQTMPAKQLKATQGEFSDKGVMKQIDKQISGQPRKPIIASQDNYIIDGHHRWLVAWNTRDSVDVFKVNINAEELLKLVKDFPKVTYKDIYTEKIDKFDKDEPTKSTVVVPGYGTMNIDSLMKNVIDQTTEMLKQMQQGTQGFRNADYALNTNKVLPTKIAALVTALDDLQAIRSKGGARSRNIKNETTISEDMLPIAEIAVLATMAKVSTDVMIGIIKTAYKTGKGMKALSKLANKAGVSLSKKVMGEAEQEELPVDVDAIIIKIQEFESQQYIKPEDADLMRRGIQSLTASRQTLNPQAILQLLTILT